MLPAQERIPGHRHEAGLERTEDTMKRLRSSLVFAVAIALTVALVPPMAAPAAAAPDGQITFAIHVSLAPTWFDPAETPGVITPFMTLYALHDALVKPMPGNAFAPSLAESWTASKDGLSYEFVLRKGVRFHNGDPVGAEDVKFSFERYKGSGATSLKARVAAVEVVDPQRVRFRLKQPWPDFMTFYATPATGAAWIVPKKYTERVGEDGFKKAPVGAGPYRFVSFNPGVELIVEAYDGYWRKTPAVKRLVFKSVPDESTRLAMLKRGETDVAYSIRGPNAEEVKRTPGLTLKATFPTFTEWLLFTEQWDPKSPWSDRRVRLAANLAIDKKAINEAEFLGYSKPAPSIIPRDFEFYWAPPAYPVRSRRGRSSSWRRRAFQAGSTRSSSRPTPCSRPRPRPSSTGFRRSASARGSGRSSARASTRRTRKSSSSISSAWAARRPATSRRGSRRS